MPWADKLYGCDIKWWDAHNGTDFKGEKWSTHGDAKGANDKREAAEKYNLKLVTGRPDPGFSTDPNVIHYGGNSGFQALNMAILLGSPYIVLVGFDMSRPGGKAHFFGKHPDGLIDQQEYEKWIPNFDKAAEDYPGTIINATPGSALECFPAHSLDEALDNYGQWS